MMMAMKRSNEDNHDNPVAFASERILAIQKMNGGSLKDAALVFRIRYRSMALEAMEVIGSWPSSEPELLALQQVWR